MSLDAEEVAKYLKANLNFFEQHAEILTEIHIPDPHGGRAISLSERQQLAMRDKNRILENKLLELIQFGEENDALSQKVHRLSLGLLGVRDLDSALNATIFNLREDFDVPHVALRLWNCVANSDRAEFSEAGEAVRAFAEGMAHPQCGHQVAEGVAEWFGESAGQLKSFACVPLRSNQVFGLLVMASEDSQRFYPEMGTLYLNRIGELVSAALLNHLG